MPDTAAVEKDFGTTNCKVWLRYTVGPDHPTVTIAWNMVTKVGTAAEIVWPTNFYINGTVDSIGNFSATRAPGDAIAFEKEEQIVADYWHDDDEGNPDLRRVVARCRIVSETPSPTPTTPSTTQLSYQQDARYFMVRQHKVNGSWVDMTPISEHYSDTKILRPKVERI